MGVPRPSEMMFSIIALLTLAIAVCNSSYVITGPRQWIAGETNQVCINVPDEGSTGGVVHVSLATDERLYSERKSTRHPSVAFQVKPGTYHECIEVAVPRKDYYNGNITFTGFVGESRVNKTVYIEMDKGHNKTFIQTDKYLYHPGQQVQFRVLTIYGTKAQVSREEYPEMWVETPSQIRIAQWKYVDNSAGLRHLAFQLADEPEEGTYTITVRDANGDITSRDFKVEEYVLPRFEVTVTPPKFILVTDSKFTFRVCANYTFGQPVKGNVTLTLENNQRRRCSVKIRKSEQVTGCKDFQFTALEMKVMDCRVYRLSATATMEEEGTGVALNGTASASVERSPIRLNTHYADKYKKPNLPYFVSVKATLLDDTPAVGVPLEMCVAGGCMNRTTNKDGLVSLTVMSEDSNRIVMSTLNCRAEIRSTTYTRDIEHQYSPSNSSLQIRAPEGKIGCGPGKHTRHLVKIMYAARDQTSALLNIQIVSRGKVQWWFTKQVDLKSSPLPFDAQDVVDGQQQQQQQQKGGHPLVTGMLSFPVSLPPTASPTIQMLVWYKRSDGEVVADTAVLEVEECLPSRAELKWSSEQGQPGEEATFTLTGEPNAICSVGVVDKSTELLNPNPDPISLKEVFNYLDSYRIFSWLNSQIDDNKYCAEKEFNAGQVGLESNSEGGGLRENIPIRPPSRYYTEYVDAIHMFTDAGLFVISDLIIETRPCEKSEYTFFDRPIFFAHESALASPGAAPDRTFADGGVGGGPTEDRPRTNFPETWLWDLYVLPGTGVLKEKVVLPDTITEWAGKAVCAHTERGIGLSERAAITTFTPFFTDLTLPPSVKRDEILPVKISVFNYLKEALPVTVILHKSSEYEVVEDQTTGGSGNQRYSCLGPQDKAVHTIKIRLLALGNVNLTVSAHTNATSGSSCGSRSHPNKRDTLIKPIKVEAEGFLREVTQSKYVCAGDVEETSVVWELIPPPNIVPDSERGWVAVVGDLLSLSLENLGSLIRMPYGCGEQNMINFAPNIFILQYLTATRQDVPEAKQKLISYMRTGYQRQLLYRRIGGSYSAFGQADDSGSTWLTAFVLKSFAQAQEFIYVDDEKLNETRRYLFRSETDYDGCIIPAGKVFSKALKGGLGRRNSSVPMTAYVLTALLESGTNPESSIVMNTTRCLLRDSSRDPYTTALKAYALALAGLPETEILLQLLTTMAVEDEDGIHWSLREQYYVSNSLTVETAGYAVLAMLTYNSEEYGLYARKIVQWITTKRNGRGGFYSTQDTVVALQAMAMYETLSYQGPLNLVATVTAFAVQERSSNVQQSQQLQYQQQSEPLTAVNFQHQFVVNEDNKLLQQQKTLPSFPTYVEIDLEGQGCAVMQTVLRYNIPEPEGSDAFSLSVESQVSPDKYCTRKRITACVSYLLPDGKSNMAVIEVNLISGYIPEKEDLKETVRRNSESVKRYEVDGSKVSFYVDEFTADELCVSFRIDREVKVENTKPGSVVVYDYYQPEFSVSKSYSFPYQEGCDR